ncbi:hypothetical protein T492DRAFT_834164 [Pavlovales sp. CCMP2436]|nr:hypothetical protein T492DRAFT_834164 [Pavlovales sp. CCMP2436]
MLGLGLGGLGRFVKNAKEQVPVINAPAVRSCARGRPVSKLESKINASVEDGGATHESPSQPARQLADGGWSAATDWDDEPTLHPPSRPAAARLGRAGADAGASDDSHTAKSAHTESPPLALPGVVVEAPRPAGAGDSWGGTVADGWGGGSDWDASGLTTPKRGSAAAAHAPPRDDAEAKADAQADARAQAKAQEAEAWAKAEAAAAQARDEAKAEADVQARTEAEAKAEAVAAQAQDEAKAEADVQAWTEAEANAAAVAAQARAVAEVQVQAIVGADAEVKAEAEAQALAQAAADAQALAETQAVAAAAEKAVAEVAAAAKVRALAEARAETQGAIDALRAEVTAAEAMAGEVSAAQARTAAEADVEAGHQEEAGGWGAEESVWDVAEATEEEQETEQAGLVEAEEAAGGEEPAVVFGRASAHLQKAGEVEEQKEAKVGSGAPARPEDAEVQGGQAVPEPEVGSGVGAEAGSEAGSMPDEMGAGLERWGMGAAAETQGEAGRWGAEESGWDSEPGAEEEEAMESGAKVGAEVVFGTVAEAGADAETGAMPSRMGAGLETGGPLDAALVRTVSADSQTATDGTADRGDSQGDSPVPLLESPVPLMESPEPLPESPGSSFGAASAAAAENGEADIYIYIHSGLAAADAVAAAAAEPATGEVLARVEGGDKGR